MLRLPLSIATEAFSDLVGSTRDSRASTRSHVVGGWNRLPFTASQRRFYVALNVLDAPFRCPVSLYAASWSRLPSCLCSCSCRDAPVQKERSRCSPPRSDLSGDSRMLEGQEASSESHRVEFLLLSTPC